MKRISIVLITLASFILLSFSLMHLIDYYYITKINKIYYDKFGDELLSEKEKGLILQKKSLERPDSLQILGSSELAGKTISSHPSNFFSNKSDGFQVDLIGRGYCQSIIHAIRIGALSKELKGKKLVIIISPQWFDSEGLTSDEFLMNFSEYQYYTFMFNKDINNTLKTTLSNRVKELAGDDATSSMAKLYAYLYTRNNIASKIALKSLEPYYRLKSYLLDIRDKRIAYDRLLLYRKGTDETYIKPQHTTYNFAAEMQKAETSAKSQTTNNNFYILNDYYNQYIKNDLDKFKGSYKNDSYTNSPEYDDLKLLLDICKSQNIKPLFVSVPVHGKWYDYCGFPKDSRDECYKKIHDLITSYNFELLDLSDKEYEKYFLKDIMHLGWKGWLYIDERIDKYYHENK